MPLSTHSTASRLCRACGFCCDGTFFGRGPLRTAEVESARAAGLTVLRRRHAGVATGAAASGATHAASSDANSGDGISAEFEFGQPCSQLAGTVCAVYEDRPQVCRDYRCRLLRAVGDGSETEDSALTHIQNTRKLAERLRGALAKEAPSKSLFDIALTAGTKDADWRRANADLMLDLGEFVLVSRKRFGVRDVSDPNVS